jgi:hypothetical protein
MLQFLEILALNHKSSSISCVVKWKLTTKSYKTYNMMAEKSDRRENGATYEQFSQSSDTLF